MNVSWPLVFAVWRRNWTLYGRTWKYTIFPNFFEPVFYLTAIGVGVGAYITEMAGMSYTAFLTPGLLCVSAMHGASFEVTYNLFVRMTYEKAYDAMLTTPVEPDDILIGEALWALTRASIYGGGFFVIAALFGLIPFPQGLVALALIPLSGLLFATIGLAFTLRIPSIDLFSFYFTLFMTPLFLFSGVFFPLEERLTPIWLNVAEILPLVHPVRLARAVFDWRFTWRALWDLGYIVCLSGALLLWGRHSIRRRLTS